MAAHAQKTADITHTPITALSHDDDVLLLPH
jgi:hypothetical protein